MGDHPPTEKTTSRNRKAVVSVLGLLAIGALLVLAIVQPFRRAAGGEAPPGHAAAALPSDDASTSAASPATCDGRVAGIVGSDGPDVLAGTPGDDVIAGLGGDDRISGAGGDDVICGGAGADALSGGAGADTLIGEDDSDTLLGDEGADALDGGPGRDACLEGDGRPASNCEARAIGEAAGVVLFEPSASTVGAGLHESLFQTALIIHPLGPTLAEAGADPASAADGVPYVVMASRNRGTPPTTGADTVVGSSSQVLSPVDGTVRGVIHYLLYCTAYDWEVVIEPDGHPDLRVIMLHLYDPTVQVGDRVFASSTPVATSWGNDGAQAEENRYFPDQYPHVHIEVDRSTKAPIPGCLPGGASHG